MKSAYERGRIIFEKLKPPVRNLVWCANGYAPTTYNDWIANDYCNEFSGFMLLFNAMESGLVDPYLMELKDEDSE